jgi:hypothetical protein
MTYQEFGQLFDEVRPGMRLLNNRIRYALVAAAQQSDQLSMLSVLLLNQHQGFPDPLRSYWK